MNKNRSLNLPFYIDSKAELVLNDFSGLFDCAETFSRYIVAYSGRKRPPIPIHYGHPFRFITATDSGAIRPPVPVDSGHFFPDS